MIPGLLGGPSLPPSLPPITALPPQLTLNPRRIFSEENVSGQAGCHIPELIMQKLNYNLRAKIIDKKILNDLP